MLSWVCHGAAPRRASGGASEARFRGVCAARAAAVRKGHLEQLQKTPPAWRGFCGMGPCCGRPFPPCLYRYIGGSGTRYWIPFGLAGP